MTSVKKTSGLELNSPKYHIYSFVTSLDKYLSSCRSCGNYWLVRC